MAVIKRVWVRDQISVKLMEGVRLDAIKPLFGKGRRREHRNLWVFAAFAVLLPVILPHRGDCQATVVSSLISELPDAPGRSPAPQNDASQAAGSISGIALDVNGGAVPQAQVTLTIENPHSVKQMTAGGDGAFSFPGLVAGAYRVRIESPGLQPYVSDEIQLHAGENLILPGIAIGIGETSTNVTVTVTQEGVAAEQIKEQEKQRVLGVFPNFYTSYIWKAAPMRRKQKYRFALRAVADPITYITVAEINTGKIRMLAAEDNLPLNASRKAEVAEHLRDVEAHTGAFE